MSNTKQIKLVSLGAESYARIDKKTKADIQYPEGVDVTEVLKSVDPEQGIVIVFPEGFKYTLLEGDQGTGKTSLLNCLLEATGNLLPPNAINSIDNNKKYNFKVYGLDGFLYHIRGTKTTYVIEKIETNPDTGEPILNEKGKEVRSELKSPKDAIKKIVGPAGISPQWLRDMTPAQQIAWLRSLYTLDTAVLTEEVKLTTDYTTTYQARTKAGNQYKEFKTLTESSEFFADQPTHEKYFKENNFEKLEEEFKAIQEKNSEYDRYEQNLKHVKDSNLVNAERALTAADGEITSIEDQIKQLQKRLEEAHKTKQLRTTELNTVKEKIANTEKWLADNLQIKTDYNNLSVKIVEATEFKAKKQKWEVMLENQKQMNHWSDEKIRLSNRLDAISAAKKKIVELFSPKIEGLEIWIPDEENKKEGLGYKGHSLIELAESELWEMAIQLWDYFNIQMVFVENISSLGSGAIEMFNKFIQNGGYIFANMMNRAEKNMKITFDNKIPK